MQIESTAQQVINNIVSPTPQSPVPNAPMNPITLADHMNSLANIIKGEPIKIEQPRPLHCFTSLDKFTSDLQSFYRRLQLFKAELQTKAGTFTGFDLEVIDPSSNTFLTFDSEKALSEHIQGVNENGLTTLLEGFNF